MDDPVEAVLKHIQQLLRDRGADTQYWSETNGPELFVNWNGVDYSITAEMM